MEEEPRKNAISNRTHSLHVTDVDPRLDVENGTLQRAREIGVEERPVEAVDGRDPARDPLAATVRLAAVQLLRQVAAARRRAVPLLAVRDDVRLALDARLLGALAPERLFVLAVLGRRRGAVLSADLRHAEDGLPALDGRLAVLWRGGVAEPGRDEGPFGPAVVDAGEVPVHGVGGGVAVELVADVDEVLDDCDVNVVDRGQVEDDGFEGWLVRFDGYGSTTARAGVVPRAILNGNVSQRNRKMVWDRGSLRQVWGRKPGWCGGFL